MNSKDIFENTKKPKKQMSLEDKIKLLNHYKETKCSLRKLANHFNIGKTQVSLIIKREQMLYEQWQSGNLGRVSKRLSDEGFEIDKKTYDWYLAKKQDNQIVTGPALQNKALELARDLGCDSFRASNGWLAKFVKRHGISLQGSIRNQNQSRSKNRETTNNLNAELGEWSRILISVLDKYSEDDIFTAVPTGLFYRTTPDDASHFLEKTCADGTFSKERLTALFCASMTGQKEKPLVIADISMEEIENMKLTEVDCKSNSLVFLTKSIMNEWLTCLENRMSDEKRSIVLFLDHLLPHHDCQLSHIRTIYFPSHIVSSNNQRINWSIIQNFKIIYRQQVLKHLIALKERDLTNFLISCNIDVPQALSWINLSWKELSPNVIHKCFEEFLYNAMPDTAYFEEVSVNLNDISNLLCAYDSHIVINAANYVSMDDDLVTEGEDPQPLEILVDADVYVDADSDAENFNESKNVISNNDISNFYYDSLRSLEQLEQFYTSQDDSKGVSLVKQLITHHKNSFSSL